MVSGDRGGIDLDATVDTRTLPVGDQATPPPRAVAGRYLLRASLGEGGHGAVFAAEDLLGGRNVAVKLLGAASGLEPARVRREVSALRLLRVPGVVQLHDEGIDRGQPFLVMDLVEGQPFPGSPGAHPWSAIEDIAMALLDTVGRIHAAGVLHRDLKPGNVLVSADRQLTVLDFGLSFGASLGGILTGSAAILGTPAYLSPELLLGEPVTARTDLHAVGLMLYQALSGVLPHDAPRVAELLRARASVPPAPLASIAPDVPGPVAEVVDALLAVHANERPRSADEVMTRLGRVIADTGADAARGPATLKRSGKIDDEGLRALFSGPERIFHLPTDGARLLASHTSGRSDRVADTVSAWVRAGFARWDGERLAIDRDSLDRLEIGLGLAPPLPERPESAELWAWEDRRTAHRAAAQALVPGTAPRLWHLMLADGGGAVGARTEVAREARVLARQLARAGRLGQAVAALGEAILAVRRRPLPGTAHDDPAATFILATWVEVALLESSPRAFDRVLYELCRAERRSQPIRQLEDLVRAALALGAGGERSLSLVEAVPPFSDRGLERRRQALRVLAARRCPLSTEEATVADAERWAGQSGDPEARACAAGWLGRLRYRQGRFEESARLHLEAATGERWATSRINAQLNAASALLEAFLFEEAKDAATKARAVAAACRHPYFEARAEWILRSAAYRSGASLEPDLDLCDLVTQVGVLDLEALVCLNEAAVAWRADRHTRAVALAGRAHRLWRTSDWRAGSLLARCLAIGAGDSAEREEVGALAAEARACPVPGIGLQALALLGRASPGAAELRPPLGLLRGVPRAHWDVRMDVLSASEAAGSLGISLDGPSSR